MGDGGFFLGGKNEGFGGIFNFGGLTLFCKFVIFAIGGGKEVPRRCLKNDQNHLLFLSEYAIIIMSACVLNGGALADILCAYLTKDRGGALLY